MAVEPRYHLIDITCLTGDGIEPEEVTMPGVIEDLCAADVERHLVATEDAIVAQIATEAAYPNAVGQLDAFGGDPEYAILFAAAAHNAGHHDTALAIAEAVMAGPRGQPGTLYTAGWLVVSHAPGGRERRDAIDRCSRGGIRSDELATLRFKDALRNQSPGVLAEVAPALETAGLSRAASLAKAESAFLSKEWEKAADLYADFLGDESGRVGVVERRAYSLIRNRRIAEARQLLTNLPVHSPITHRMLEVRGAALGKLFEGAVLTFLAPLLLIYFVVMALAGLLITVGSPSEGWPPLVVGSLGSVLTFFWTVKRDTARAFSRRFMDKHVRGGLLRDLHDEVSRLGEVL